MLLQIPDEILDERQFSTQELKTELAVALFQRDRLTLVMAARLAEIPRLEFQRLLGARQIPLHYDASDFEQDLRALDSLTRR